MRCVAWLLLFAATLVRAGDFLDPAEAFRPSVRAIDARTLELSVDVAEGYYLYRGRFRFALEDAGASLGQAQFPAGEPHEDEYLGKDEVYFRHVAVRLPVTAVPAGASSVHLKAVVQGCAVKGFCYPPQTHRFTVALDGLPAAAAAPAPVPVTAALPVASTAAASVPAEGSDESSVIARALSNSGLLANLLFFFVAGLGLSLTPCVLPMIPILSGIIVGQGGKVSRGRGFALAAAYVGGMAITYSLAGVGAGLGGTLISSSLQNPWVLGSFAAVFVVLSFSMFGFYELQMPSALQTRLSSSADSMKGGSLFGVFVMGAVSALIVGPCVAAPLAGALLYIGKTGNALLGGGALFVMALGMGVPLLLVGLSAGSLLPRAGAWMESVKKVFGVILLATAVYLVSPVIPPAARMIAWSLLLIVPAIYMHAIDPLPAAASGWSKLWKGLGIVMLITGAAMLLGVLAGNRDPLQPLMLTARASGTGKAGPALAFEPVATVAELDARIAASPMPVMLDVYAEWCAACKEMEHLTFGDPAVRARLAGFRLLKADVTENDPEDQALLKRFGLFGPPGIAFFEAGGAEHAGLRLVGFKDAQEFLQHIASIR